MNHGQATSHDSPPLSPLDYSRLASAALRGSRISYFLRTFFVRSATSTTSTTSRDEISYFLPRRGSDKSSGRKDGYLSILARGLNWGKASKRQATFCLITRNTSETSRTRRRMKLLTYIHLSSKHNVTRSEYNLLLEFFKKNHDVGLYLLSLETTFHVKCKQNKFHLVANVVF